MKGVALNIYIFNGFVCVAMSGFIAPYIMNFH